MNKRQNAKLLAEKLAAFLLEQETVQKDETNVVLSNILSRLERIENELSAKNNAIPVVAPHIHPSQEKFDIVEAAEVLLAGSSEKACRFEPDKPCDYCSMCSSRGY
jgi:hypothetical protein